MGGTSPCLGAWASAVLTSPIPGWEQVGPRPTGLWCFYFLFMYQLAWGEDALRLVRIKGYQEWGVKRNLCSHL